MPAKDRSHELVKRALINDGWRITQDQVKLKLGERRLWIDLRAAHDAQGLEILVEIKEMDAPSPIDDLANAVGKYLLYRTALENKEIAIPIYLAVSLESFEGILSEEIGRWMIQRFHIQLVVFDPATEEVVRWIA